MPPPPDDRTDESIYTVLEEVRAEDGSVGEIDDEEMKRLRTAVLCGLAQDRPGCWALFHNERLLVQLVHRAQKEILVQGWLEALRTGFNMGSPLTDVERDTYEEALKREDQFRRAQVVLSSHLSESGVNQEEYHACREVIRWWTSGPPMARATESTNSEQSGEDV